MTLLDGHELGLGLVMQRALPMSPGASALGSAIPGGIGLVDAILRTSVGPIYTVEVQENVQSPLVAVYGLSSYSCGLELTQVTFVRVAECKLQQIHDAYGLTLRLSKRVHLGEALRRTRQLRVLG